MGNYRICWVQNFPDLFRITFGGSGKNYDFVVSAHSGQKLFGVRPDKEFPDFAIVLSDLEVGWIQLRGFHWIGCEDEGIIEVDKECFFAVIGVSSG